MVLGVLRSAACVLHNSDVRHIFLLLNNLCNDQIHAVHLSREPASIAINASNAAHRSFISLGIRTMMAINAIKLDTTSSLLANCFASNDSEPLGILDAERIVVFVRASAISSFVMAATTTDVVLVTELEFLQFIDTIVVVIHLHIETLLVFVLADDWSNNLGFGCWLCQVLDGAMGDASCQSRPAVATTTAST